MGNSIVIRQKESKWAKWKRILTRRKLVRKPIYILVLGLDNSGKSTIVNYLYNKSLVTKEKIVPTIGFRTVVFKHRMSSVRLFDIGGSSQIRPLWPKYYNDVHGVIYVVDSQDVDRIDESANVFKELVCHESIKRKPILFLGNKQDLRDSLDKEDIIERMNLENVVNFAKCFTRVEVCSCFPCSCKHTFTKDIDEGFDWLVGEIEFYYEKMEALLKENKSKSKLQRSSTLKSWVAETVRNPYDYSDSDSETYLKPIVRDVDLLPYKSPRKKKGVWRRLFCLSSNRTAPLNGGITTESMRELISSIQIEDLIRSTEVDANAVAGYKHPPRFFRKKRPTTAPPRAELRAKTKTSQEQQQQQQQQLEAGAPAGVDEGAAAAEIPAAIGIEVPS